MDRPDDTTLVALLDTLADAVVIADPQGTIVYWNQGATHLFGWPAEQALGGSLDLIIPEKQRRAHWDGYERVMQSGVTKYGSDLLRVPALHADGQRRSIAFTVSLLKDGDGKVTGIAAVMRDETQRWADEQALRKRVRELEGA
ncbi:MAG: PAS domain-containing protein [Acidimicrobiia bacterium]